MVLSVYVCKALFCQNSTLLEQGNIFIIKGKYYRCKWSILFSKIKFWNINVDVASRLSSMELNMRLMEKTLSRISFSFLSNPV